jgi:hypothetical protein
MVFAPPRFRHWRLAACAGLLLLQVAIGVTGNYGFFSLLTAALCLTLVDDQAWRRILPFRALRESEKASPGGGVGGGRCQRLVTVGTLVLFGLGALTFVGEINRDLQRRGRPSLDLTWSEPILTWVRPLRSVNGYDLKTYFDHQARQFWSAELSQIYPSLKRLESRGWLTSHREASAKGPPRKVYTRTPDGRDALLEWLTRACKSGVSASPTWPRSSSWTSWGTCRPPGG